MFHHLTSKAKQILPLLLTATTLTLATTTSPKTHPLTIKQTHCEYWVHDPKDFDLYLTNPTPSDLPKLLKAFQEGQEVWPWIWTQPNSDGPHYVFVGITPEALKRISELRTVLFTKGNKVNVNILIIADVKEVACVPDGFLDHCGVVTTATVKIVNDKAQLLMLDDERVVSYDHLIVA